MFEWTVISSLLGLSLGSFVNVCIYRIPRGLSIISKRSFCPHCDSQLRWFELIPVLSFLLTLGKCKTCGKRISFFYPVVEILFAVLTFMVFLQYGISVRAFELLIFSFLMLAVAIIDWKHFIIPNQVIIAGLVLGFIVKGFNGQNMFISSVQSSFVSFITLLLIMIIGNYLFQKQTMGMGDVKLAGVIGLFIGYQNFVIALWLAAVVGIVYAVINPSFIRKSQIGNRINLIPLGSFLSVASVLIFFFEEPIQNLIDAWLIWNL